MAAKLSELEERNLSVEIRKLRKKLRQIENLEVLDRSLTSEEQEKVNKKGSIRLHLLDKLEKQVNTATSRIIPTAPPLTTTSKERNRNIISREEEEEDPIDDNEDNEIVEEIDVEMKRKLDVNDGEEVTSHGDDKRTRCEDQDWIHTGTQATAQTSQSNPQESSQKSAPKSKKKSPKKKKEGSPPKETGWANVKFLVRELEGHNDLVYAVACQGSTLISGGRDTMVKVWDADTGAEVRSLGGHTGTITSLMILPHHVCQKLASQHDLNPESDKLGLSGSTDCSIRLWCLNTGQTLRSIYTYNSVECLGLVGSCVVSGSDGGKVELWDLESEESKSLFTTIGHDEAVTCIKVNGNFIVTTSEDGLIKLWELRDQSLHTIFVSENITGESTSKPIANREIKSLAYRNYIYYGDDGLNVKALDWKKGMVHKLKHHLGDFGSTSAMCTTGDVLACAGYDLDNGLAYINFWNIPEEVYLATLNDQDTSRIMTMDCTTTETGDLRFVTGGQEVKVWDRIPKTRYSPQDAIPIEFNYQFTTQAQDSDINSDDSETDDDAEIGARPHGRRRWSQNSESDQQQAGWFGSWCTVV